MNAHRSVRSLSAVGLLVVSLLQAAPALAGKPAFDPFGVAQKKAVRDLPLHNTGVAEAKSDVIAVFLTGDGGWAPFDRHICEDLSRRGIPTTALDTGDYFSKMREPAAAAAMLAHVLQVRLSETGATRVLIVGYSFGGGVAPFMVNRLPESLRAKVSDIVLLAPEALASFQVTLAERAGLAYPGARPLSPELEDAIRHGIKVSCFYGESDEKAVCPNLKLTGVSVFKFRGNHGFDGDHQGIANAIAWRAQAGTVDLE